MKKIEYIKDINNCHICISHCLDKSGYVCIIRKLNNKIFYRCHRYIYQKYKGKIKRGLHILHICNNRACINPEHLYQGTNEDNMKDKTYYERQCRGETHGRHKLTEKEVIEIKKIIEEMSLQPKYKIKDLSKIFNIERHKMSKIIKGIIKVNNSEEILKLYNIKIMKRKYTDIEICKLFNVSRSTIRAIVNGRTWSYILIN